MSGFADAPCMCSVTLKGYARFFAFLIGDPTAAQCEFQYSLALATKTTTKAYSWKRHSEQTLQMRDTVDTPITDKCVF